MKEKVEIDWETNCVNAIVGHILSNDYMKQNFVVILTRALLRLEFMKQHDEAYYRGFGK